MFGFTRSRVLASVVILDGIIRVCCVSSQAMGMCMHSVYLLPGLLGLAKVLLSTFCSWNSEARVLADHSSGSLASSLFVIFKPTFDARVTSCERDEA